MKNFNSTSSSYYVFLLSLLVLIGCGREEIGTDQVQKEALPQPEIAFPNSKGKVSTITYDGKTLEVEKIGDHYVLEGDIIIPVDCAHDHSKSTGRKTRRWPEGIVVYEIDPNLPNKSRVYNAISHWEQNTPIRFVVRTTQTDYVLFQKGLGCSSSVGKRGGQQRINLADDCSTGTTIHEIGHAVGLWHEQSRKDRDQYLTINFQNIESGKEHNFKTYQQRGTDGNEFSPFDFNSIMLYHPYSFSKNGQPTITRVGGGSYSVNRTGLSAQDIEGVRKMYFNNVLYTNQILTRTIFLNSNNGDNYLYLQNDGNLVIYRNGTAIWASNTGGSTSNRLIVQGDGNLVLYNSQNVATWSTGTHGMGNNNFLAMQDDGNLVLYSSNGTVVWASNTGV